MKRYDLRRLTHFNTLDQTKGYVNSYDKNKEFHHKMFGTNDNMGILALYKLNDVNEEELKENFEDRHDYFKRTNHNSVDLDCYDTCEKVNGFYKEKKQWKPCLGGKGSFISVVKNETLKNNDLADYYMMLYTQNDKLSDQLHQSNTDYDRVTLDDYMHTDSAHNIMWRSAFDNNTRLADTAGKLLGLNLQVEKDEDVFVDKNKQEVARNRAVPDFVQFNNVMLPSSCGKYYNYYNHCTPNLNKIKEDEIKDCLPALHRYCTSGKKISKLNNNHDYRVVLSGHDNKPVIVYCNDWDEDHHEMFTGLTESETKKSYQHSKNTCYIGSRHEDNTKRNVKEMLEDLYSNDKKYHKIYKFDEIIKKLV